MKISVFWFRRDLRLEDNMALYHALESGWPVLPIFIFDTNILDELPADDARVNFIFETLHSIHDALQEHGSGLMVKRGDPVRIWREMATKHDIGKVFINRDYEPYALERDKKVHDLLSEKGIPLIEFKDQVIFEKSEILKNNGKPYTVYTPYSRKWLGQFDPQAFRPLPLPDLNKFIPVKCRFSTLSDIGFTGSSIRVREYDLSVLDNYAARRNLPAEDATSHLGPHLRFGTVSIRRVIQQLGSEHGVFLGELIWREFFMQILWHFPNVVDRNFHARYDGIKWRNNEDEFQRWCQGRTGYPIVDAGMRQLNASGTMHNRVRMITASFLCKHLLIDWRWGEAYFAGKLLDYELSSNNGNWQWAAGTGCDAAPYFRVFNPSTQMNKFDKEQKYIRKWVPEYGTSDYLPQMIEHKTARERALKAYRHGLPA